MKEQVSQTKKGSVLRTSMYVAVLIGLAAFLIFSILAAITFGNADLSLKDVYSVIAYKLFHIKISTLSGGEQQRVILARALAQQTPALILDEPTNHLDITHQIMLMELVKKLNVTVISAIHDLNIAAAYCDKIYVLKDGVLEGYGTPQEVLTSELIKRIYQVDSEVVNDSRGKMHILFL